MHPKLQRQIAKHYGSPEALPAACRDLARVVDEAYLTADKDRQLLERSLELTSKELVERFEVARRSLASTEERAAELESTRSALLNALEDTEEMQASLRRSEELFRTVFRSAEIGMAIGDARGRILEANPAFLAMFGYDEAAPPARFSELLPADERPGDADLLRSAAAGVERGLAVERRLSRKEGELVWAHVGATLLPAAEGQPRRILAMFEDITERKRAEERVHELNVLRATFINIVAHQLRTPLNAIRWNLESLLGRDLGEMTVAQHEFIRITYEADLEVIRRIHDLLTAMDIEEGRVMLSPEENSLESLWHAVMGDWQRACALKKLTCTSAPPAQPLPQAAFDAEKIRHVLTKLMENAVSYTPEGGRITARLSADGRRVRFEIADTGIGIPAAEQPRIFTRFYRASNAATMKPDASGLGLSIAKYFVEQHGGAIGFMSKEGKGSTFWFELPVKG